MASDLRLGILVWPQRRLVGVTDTKASELAAAPAGRATDGPNNSAREQAFVAFLESKRLGLWLAAAAMLLSASCLWLGFYLDDYVGRYIYSDLPGAKRLFALYAGGYGLTNGNPADTHWQIEAGWAPWWTYDRLLIRLFRPLGVVTHWLDMQLWPNSVALMHLQSLAWLALLVLVITRMYRGALGARIGGLAALLFAFDHTHGFVVGYICNRHALLTAVLGVLCLDQHVRAHASQKSRQQLLAYVIYAIALGSGESTLAILGYLGAYALCVETQPLLRRGLRLAPYVLITLVWRVAYTRAGFGAYGSGLYIDPGRDPWAYLLALCERAPVLLLGQFLAPPAEVQAFADAPWGGAILGLAVVFTAALVLALLPLLRRNRMACFWALGALGSLVPAASTYPHNRQLLLTSFGAMALLAQLWHFHLVDLRGQVLGAGLRFSRELCKVLVFVHLFASPLALPITTCEVVMTARLSQAPESIGDEIAGRDAVFLTAPDYFAVKLVQLQRRIEHRPLARRWRALGFGPEHIVATRVDARTLELVYREGILSSPVMELYRDRRLPMQRGERVELEGLSIEVLDLTRDGRAQRVRFRFDNQLDAPTFRFFYWVRGRFEHFALPAIGGSRELPPAVLAFGLK
jgi:hypothetical protein